MIKITKEKSSVKVRARAKINLSLDVIGKRENGYHDVDMIMQQIELYDDVFVHKIDEDKIILTCTDEFLPTDDKNIAYRAAMLMKEKFNCTDGFEIHIDKNIPVAAGLAGGSTDAAAVIKAVNWLLELNLSTEQMMQIGFELGADVPFCILEGSARATGLGEILTPIRGLEHAWLILIKPGFGVSTKEVYTALNLSEILDHPDTEAMLLALENQSRHEVIKQLHNVLEKVTIKNYPQVADVKSYMKCHGADGVLMSGSGPTVFGIYNSYNKAKSAFKKIKKNYPQSYLVSTYNKIK